MEDNFLKATIIILYEEINGLMEHIEEDYPALFAEFNEAKKIKYLGIRHQPSDNPDAPPAQ